MPTRTNTLLMVLVVGTSLALVRMLVPSVVPPPQPQVKSPELQQQIAQEWTKAESRCNLELEQWMAEFDKAANSADPMDLVRLRKMRSSNDCLLENK